MHLDWDICNGIAMSFEKAIEVSRLQLTFRREGIYVPCTTERDVSTCLNPISHH